MFASISNSWALAKASWKVLLADKELFVFPIISMFAMILVTATFMIPPIFNGMFERMHNGDQVSQIQGALVLFAFYVVSYSVIFYFNTALIGCALIRLRGGNPTLSDGFKIANSHFDTIITYALLAATVGVILQWLRERGVIGRIVAGLFGLAWNIATFLVVPVLITENLGPIDSVKRSTALLKKTWGEQIAGSAGIGLVFGMMIFATIGIGGVIGLLMMNISHVLAVVMGVMVVLAVVALSLLSSTLTGIYTAAVYHYTTAGTADGFFDKDLIMNAFKADNKK